MQRNPSKTGASTSSWSGAMSSRWTRGARSSATAPLRWPAARSWRSARPQNCGRAGPEAEVLGDHDAVITPGFVNGHHHLTGDRLVRSAIPDELAPGESIFTWAVPVHAAHSPDDDELSATSPRPSRSRTAITTIVEAGTVAHPERVADGTATRRRAGRVGTWGWDVDDAPFAAPAAEVLARQAEVDRAASTVARPLVHGWVTLVGHDLMSDELLTGASALARDRGVGLTFHISPHPAMRRRISRAPGCARSCTSTDSAPSGRTCCSPTPCTSTMRRCEIVLRTPSAVAYTPWAYLRLGQGVTAARPPRRARIAGRPHRARLRLRERRRRASTRCASPRSPPASPRTRRSIRPASARTTRSSCATIRGAGSDRHGRSHRIARGRASEPTSSCTTRRGPALDAAQRRPGAPARVGRRRPRRPRRGRRWPGRRARRPLHHRRPGRAAADGAQAAPGAAAPSRASHPPSRWPIRLTSRFMV